MITAIPKTVNANQEDTQSVGASSVGMGSVAGHSKTRQAQQEVLDQATVLIKESYRKLHPYHRRSEAHARFSPFARATQKMREATLFGCAS